MALKNFVVIHRDVELDRQYHLKGIDLKDAIKRDLCEHGCFERFWKEEKGIEAVIEWLKQSGGEEDAIVLESLTPMNEIAL